ncbi:hypothetical protein A5641_14100 [Mycobacterium sp. 1554424.7]|nr:hypothetical protein A5641_14100 [Mycobacterium sp. 1554424.7]
MAPLQASRGSAISSSGRFIETVAGNDQTANFTAIRRAVLLIADIGGYTHYMHWNRTHLAHAQLAAAGLLDAVVDAGKGLKLANFEGDAAPRNPRRGFRRKAFEAIGNHMSHMSTISWS